VARYWTDREIELLKKFYPHAGDTIDLRDLATMLNRSVNSIRCKADDFGLKGAYGKDNIDEEILKQLEARIEI